MARTLSQGLLLTAKIGVNKRKIDLGKTMDKKSPCRWGTDTPSGRVGGVDGDFLMVLFFYLR